MIELLPELEQGNGIPLYTQLHGYIKHEIERGALAEGARLPSIRALAQKLGVSITTIRTAYDQLVVEGYITSSDRAGYHVCELDHLRRESRAEVSADPEQTLHYDIRCFDFVKWRKHLAQTLTYDMAALLKEADFQGEPSFRAAIADYIYQSRGVSARREDIVVGAGSQQLMELLAALFDRMGKRAIGFENPGYQMNERSFRSRGFRVQELELDAQGVVPDEAAALDVLYVSPAHQFPTGIVMSTQRRRQLLAWAQQCGGYIIEDDYDSELRYFGKALPSLKALDREDRVIHVGSFATTLLPSMKISYMVLPRSLSDAYREIKLDYAQGVSKVDQLALTAFMTEGNYQRHIKRIRRIYNEKSIDLSIYIKRKHPEITIVSNTSGLFLTLERKHARSEREIAAAFQRRGIKATAYADTVKTPYQAQTRRWLLYFYNWEIGALKQQFSEVMQELQEGVP